MTKNECERIRDKDNPYEIWRSADSWEWRVLKKYQNPKVEAYNFYAKWYCFITSPSCPDGEYGDSYASTIKLFAHKVEDDGSDDSDDPTSVFYDTSKHLWEEGDSQ